MNLRDLKYLVAVADLKHFGKAAESCHVSQPTLSGQLKKLEEHLGIQLLERNNRRVLITTEGEAIVKRARFILEKVADLEDLARGFANPMQGKIRLGLIPTVAPYLLPHMMEPIKEKYPALELLLVEAQTETQIRKLKDGELDAAILALPVEGAEGMSDLFLYEEPFLVAVPKDHPFDQKDSISATDLDGQEILLLEDGHCLRGQALDVCMKAGAHESADFRATSMETLRHMVASGSGVTLVPYLAASEFWKDRGGPITYLPFKETPAPGRTIGIMFRSTSGRTSVFRALSALIRQVMAPRFPTTT